MQIPFHHTESKLVRSKVQTQKAKFYDFFSHKQRFSPQIKTSKQQKFKYQQDMKYLIHQWINFETSLNQKHQISQQGREYFYENTSLQKPKLSSRIQNQIQQNDQIALSRQMISYIFQHHPIFSRINFNLAQALINIGVFNLYGKGTQIPYIYYEEKHKNQCNEKKKLGIIMYGRLKLYNKIQSFDKIIDQNDSIGEHGIDTLSINFPDYRNVKVKSIDDQTAILWIKKRHYEVLFQESMKCGLKEQLKKFQSHLKLSWIKKSIRKS